MLAAVVLGAVMVSTGAGDASAAGARVAVLGALVVVLASNGAGDSSAGAGATGLGAVVLVLAPDGGVEGPVAGLGDAASGVAGADTAVVAEAGEAT